MGVLSGAPTRPEDIDGLMHQMNQLTVAHALPAAEDDGDGPRGSRRKRK